MKNKQLVVLLVTFFIATQPITSNAFSWDSWRNVAAAPLESITNYFDKETLNKLVPLAIIAGLVGLYYLMRKKTNLRGVDYYYRWVVNQPEILATLSQLPVYSQINDDGGGGASCGYQTLLRSMQIVAAKINNESNELLKKTLMDQSTIAWYFGSSESKWRREIIKKRKNDEIKKLLHKKLLLGLKSDGAVRDYDKKTISKIKELYRSSLGLIEDTILTKINDSTQLEFPYEFTDKEIKKFIKKSVPEPEGEYAYLGEKIKTDQMIHDFFDFDVMRNELLAKDSILQLQPIIEDIKNKEELGEWLNDGEMEFLWKKNKHEIIPMTAICEFKAISNFNFIGQEGFDEVTSYIAENIRPKLLSKEPFFQIFAIGTMTQYTDTSGSQGHWYPLVMQHKTDGTRSYFVTDSLGNGDRTHDERVLALIGMIEKP